MKPYKEEHYRNLKHPGLTDCIHTHDSLSEALTGQATSIENYARIIQSRSELRRQQDIMEEHFGRFGVQLSKPSGNVRIDGRTEEVTHLKVHTHTKLNPAWQHKQARQRRNEFLHFIKDQDIRINQLHYFTMPAADSRLPLGVNLEYIFKDASARMRRTLQQIKRKFGDSVMPFVTALEWTVCPVEGIYLHYNVIIYIPDDLSENPKLPKHDRRSIVWKNSGISYAHRSLGLGQFLDYFNKQWKQDSRRFVSYNGTVKDAASTLLYINKSFDAEPIKDHPEITKWLYVETKGLTLYHTKTLFKDWRSKLKKSKKAVFEYRNETYVRETSQSDRDLYDLPDKEEDVQDKKDGDDNDPAIAENKILGRIAPTFNYRYKTPSIIVMNYTSSPLTMEGKRRLCKIRDFFEECRRHFHNNTDGEISIDQIIAEKSILEDLFIYDTMDDTSFEDKIDEFHRRMLNEYYLSHLNIKPSPDLDNFPDPDTDNTFSKLQEEGTIPPEGAECGSSDPLKASRDDLVWVRAFNDVFG